jgi:hypothetical protein
LISIEHLHRIAYACKPVSLSVHHPAPKARHLF